MKHPHRKHRAHQRQEGAALLIVLFVLMMATTTAVYTLSSSQMEVRAAGGLHQAMRAKFVAEAATMGLLTLCQQQGVNGCVNFRGAPDNVTATLRQNYALPNWGSENVYSVTSDDFSIPSYTGNGAPFLASDSVLSGGAGSAWTASFLSVYERWDVPSTGKDIVPRIVVSTYGALTTPSDVRDSSEQRDAHSTVSATRVFINISN